MSTMHLTDEKIQDYLDGNLSQAETSIIRQHLHTCPRCQSEVAQYQDLYVGLGEDVAFVLSPDFSDSVLKTIRAESRQAFLTRLWNVLLPIIGIAVGIGAIIYFIDFKLIIKTFTDSLDPARYFDPGIISALNQTLTKFDVNLHLIVFAGLSLLAVILFDHLLVRHKEKFFFIM